jgi:hypothetical protein
MQRNLDHSATAVDIQRCLEGEVHIDQVPAGQDLAFFDFALEATNSG